jgi:adenosyl cobinamide kinase/adenosyl cobinamide phosphate guanylyltransferase
VRRVFVCVQVEPVRFGVFLNQGRKQAVDLVHNTGEAGQSLAQAADEEMKSRIAEHQLRRGEGWRTVEEPIALADVLDREASRPVLIDCLTLWLTNLTLGGHDIAAATAGLEAALSRRHGPTVVISNEVGLGIVPQTPLGRSFRDDAGRLNQRIAALAQHVVFMIAGLPLTLK